MHCYITLRNPASFSGSPASCSINIDRCSTTRTTIIILINEKYARTRPGGLVALVQCNSGFIRLCSPITLRNPASFSGSPAFCSINIDRCSTTRTTIIILINAKCARTRPGLVALVQCNSGFIRLCSPDTCKGVFNPNVTIIMAIILHDGLMCFFLWCFLFLSLNNSPLAIFCEDINDCVGLTVHRKEWHGIYKIIYYTSTDYVNNMFLDFVGGKNTKKENYIHAYCTGKHKQMQKERKNERERERERDR